MKERRNAETKRTSMGGKRVGFDCVPASGSKRPKEDDKTPRGERRALCTSRLDGCQSGEGLPWN